MSFENKLVAILNKDLEPGVALNADATRLAVGVPNDDGAGNAVDQNRKFRVVVNWPCHSHSPCK